MTTIGQRSFAHNTIFNFLSQVSVIAIAILCVPYIVSKLGDERFGLLSILWMFVGYLGFLDLGIAQAAIKFVSESIARLDRVHAAQLIRVTGGLALILGLIASLLVFGLSLIGTERFIDIAPDLRLEATQSLRLLAICLPAVLLYGTLRSVPLAFNRFDLVNGLQTAGGLLQWGGSSLTLFFGGGFFGVVLLTVLTRYFLVTVQLWFSVGLLPEIIHSPRADKKAIASRLMGFGGWLTIAQAIGPFQLFLERIFIGSLLSLAWVTYYAVPADALMRLLLIPSSLVGTLYPFVSGQWISEEGRMRTRMYYERSVKYTFLVMLPIMVGLVVYGRDVLQLWMGEDFAIKSVTVMVILSIGMVFHALAQLPNAMLQAVGRPDLIAKLLLVELPLYVGLCLLLTSMFGINGTAYAWLIRVFAEFLFLFVATRRMMANVAGRTDSSYWWQSTGLILAGGLFLSVFRSGTENVYLHISAVVLCAIIYGIGLWRYILNDNDKNLIASLRTQWIFSGPTA